MFQLSNSEIDSVRSQFVTSRKKDFFAGQEGGRRYLPYAFTEQGIYMLATVLRGKLAEQQSIFIMRTFREMRHYIRQNQQFVTRNESFNSKSWSDNGEAGSNGEFSHLFIVYCFKLFYTRTEWNHP